MCCSSTIACNISTIERFKSRRRSKLVFYKVLNRRGNSLYSVIQSGSSWQPGYRYAHTIDPIKNKSRRLYQSEIDAYRTFHKSFNNLLDPNLRLNINSGIHVYLNVNIAKDNHYIDNTNEYLVPVICEKDDFLGSDYESVVFNRVFLEQKTYDRIMDQ